MDGSVKVQKKIKSIVIGGGFGGIAAALRLRALGHQVTLLEKLNCLGGRAQVFEKNGFKHDAGPTVITAPFLFDELFQLFGENIFTRIMNQEDPFIQKALDHLRKPERKKT